MGSKGDVTFASLTDVGLVRDHNEDYYGFFEPDAESLFATKGRLFVVCDGMGGHAAGEVASQIAVKTIGKAYFSDRAPANPAAALKASVEAANREILEEAGKNPGREGMGTTVTALSLVGRSAVVVNVGDSRTYLVRDDAITQISQDHSWVMEQVRTGSLTPEQAENHPYSNVITRSLGSQSKVDVDVFGPIDVMPGDIFLLMSDGLSGLVKDNELLTYANTLPPDEAAERLVELAKERGGHDNITVQIIRVNRVAGKRIKKGGIKVKVKKRSIALAAALCVLFAVGIAAAALYIFPKLRGPREPVDIGPPPAVDINVINPLGMVFGDGTIHILDTLTIITCDPEKVRGAETEGAYLKEIPIAERVGKPLALTYIENPPGVNLLGVMGMVEKGAKRKDTLSFSTYNLDKGEWSEAIHYQLPTGDPSAPGALTIFDNDIYFIFSGGLYWASSVGKSRIEKSWKLKNPTGGFAFPFYENDTKFISPPGFVYVDGGRFYLLHVGEGVPREICPDGDPFPMEVVDINIFGTKEFLIASKERVFRVDLTNKKLFEIPAPEGGLKGEITRIAGGGDAVYLLIRSEDGEYKIAPAGEIDGGGEGAPLCK